MTNDEPSQPQIIDGKISLNGKTFEIPNVTLTEVTGRGANGVIFGGQDTLLDRSVVAKLYLPKTGDQRDKREQAIQEGRKLARLRHENIVQVFAAYPHEAGVILVMERLKGPSLKDFLDEPRELAERLQLWYDINEGLKYAHSQGVYHGDLHWKNVVVEEKRAVLIDFGTSLFEKREGQSREREVNMPWELLGRLFGDDELHTPSKGRLAGMSPEDSLFGCAQAVELIKLQRRVVEAFKTSDGYHDGYEQRGSLYHLATIISEFPYFPADAVLNWVQNNVPVDEQFHFYDQLEAALGGRRDNKGQISISYTPEEPVQQKRNRVVASMRDVSQLLLDENRIQ